MVIEVALYLLVGLAGGAIGGLLGTGSSLVILPALTYLLPYTIKASALSVHMAVATCMATIVVTAISVSYHYIKNGETDWKLLKRLITAYFLGPIVGAIISSYLPVHVLKIYIAIFLIFAGLQLLIKKHCPDGESAERLPSQWILWPVVFIICVLSSMAGVAIGLLMVPLLHHFGVELKRAIQSSLIAAVLYTFIGAITYMVMGVGVPDLPALSLGYVYLPAFLFISVGVLITSGWAAKLSFRVATRHLKVIFSVFLMLAGINLLLAAFNVIKF